MSESKSQARLEPLSTQELLEQDAMNVGKYFAQLKAENAALKAKLAKARAALAAYKDSEL